MQDRVLGHGDAELVGLVFKGRSHGQALQQPLAEPRLFGLFARDPRVFFLYPAELLVISPAEFGDRHHLVAGHDHCIAATAEDAATAGNDQTQDEQKDDPESDRGLGEGAEKRKHVGRGLKKTSRGR